MATYIMAIDQGTTSTRALLVDKDGEVISIVQREIENEFPKPGWVEQDANTIWGSVVGVMNEVLATSGVKEEEIASIGITNQRETTVVWDKRTGQPVHPAIVWQSRQTEDLCKQVEQHAPRIKELTGLTVDPYFSASKIRFILDAIPNGQKRAENGDLLFGTIDSWLVWKMTGGTHITDVSNASRTMLMNLKTLEYEKELLELWNIPRVMLPEIRDTSELYGYANQVFDTPIPITAVIGDQQASLFGQLCLEGGETKNTYGTGCFLLMNTKDQLIRSKHGLISSVGWRINGQVDYVLEGSVFVAGAAIQWLRDGLRILHDSSESEKRATSIESTEGVYVVPAFTGLGAPYWRSDVRGAIFGLTRGTSQEHIIRATLESLAYQTFDILHAMQEDSGMTLAKLQVDGGASKNDFLVQFQSDILNCEVQRAKMSENTGLGAAYLAGLGIGYWKDFDELKSIPVKRDIFTSKSNEQQRKNRLEGWHDSIHKVLS